MADRERETPGVEGHCPAGSAFGSKVEPLRPPDFVRRLLDSGRAVIARLPATSIATPQPVDASSVPAVGDLAPLIVPTTLGIGTKRIRLAIRVAEMAALHGAAALDGVTTRQLRLVAALPEPERGRLLEHIRLGRLGVAETSREARRIRTKLGLKGGRPPLPDYVKAIRELAHVAARVRTRLRDLERAAENSELRAAELRRLATRLTDLGEEIRLRLRPIPRPTPR